MTVAELIKQLQYLDQEAEVVCWNSDQFGYASMVRADEVFEKYDPFYAEDTTGKKFVQIS